MYRVKLSDSGHITIPSEVRKKFNLRPGDKVELKRDKSEIIVTKK